MDSNEYYYQTLLVIRLISEVMWDLYLDALEDWIHTSEIIGKWVDDLSNFIENLLHGVEKQKLKGIAAVTFLVKAGHYK